jgi:hypothetical protein
MTEQTSNTVDQKPAGTLVVPRSPDREDGEHAGDQPGQVRLDLPDPIQRRHK